MAVVATRMRWLGDHRGIGNAPAGRWSGLGRIRSRSRGIGSTALSEDAFRRLHFRHGEGCDEQLSKFYAPAQIVEEVQAPDTNVALKYFFFDCYQINLLCHHCHPWMLRNFFQRETIRCIQSQHVLE